MPEQSGTIIRIIIHSSKSVCDLDNSTVWVIYTDLSDSARQFANSYPPSQGVIRKITVIGHCSPYLTVTSSHISALTSHFASFSERIRLLYAGNNFHAALPVAGGLEPGTLLYKPRFHESRDFGWKFETCKEGIEVAGANT